MTKKTDFLIEEFSREENLYKQFGESMNSLITNLLQISNIDTHSTHFRVKNENSLKEKIEKKDKYNMLNEITDLLGVRIITYYSSDTDRVAKLIREEFHVDEDNTIDKRKTHEPDRFGYMSLHYVVSLKENRISLIEYKRFNNIKFEIQIRTILQHTWAEIEHDLGYKSKNSVPSHIRRKFSILSGTLELIDGAFIEIKNDLSEYDNQTRIDLSKNIPANQENYNDINDIYIKNFVLESSVISKMYDAYLRKSKNKISEGAVALYPSPAKYETDISFSTIVKVLHTLGIEKSSELINLIESLSSDDKIFDIICSFLPFGVGNKYLSKYFFVLFSLYAYIYKEGKVELFNNFNGKNLILEIGRLYDSL